MNLVEKTLLENIGKPSSFFVFPTDIAVSRWVDRLLLLQRESGRGTGTVAVEKFTAWDRFKQDSIRSRVQDRRSVPSVLRKMFVAALIRENAALCAEGKPPVFTALILPRWAGQAGSFTDWIAGILPHLALWFARTAGLPIAEIHGSAAVRKGEAMSGEDRDLFNLAFEYARFLDRLGLFEPAWETPPFADTGRECFIFFSESLLDFEEYREILEKSDHVRIVRTGEGESERRQHEVFFYTNSRSEITEAALYILALHRNKKIPWDSISVSIPENESYGPYLFREFENRNIPYIRQTGKPLALYPSGQLFKAIAECVASDFSFSTMTALLLNRRLPWKDGSVIDDLIGFGIRNNCISSWTEEKEGEPLKINVWEDAFEHPFGGINPKSRFFFQDLKRRANAMRHASSFAEIRKNYFIFRERFFDMDKCLDETDLVLSRCISELMELVEIEDSYRDVGLQDPYAFFTEQLEQVPYLAQRSASGVAILPYRTAAPAPFDCHIVLGASQDNLQEVFSPLPFISGSKRQALDLKDNDASLAFIELHRYNSRLPAAFFCSEQTFSGYAIPHNALNAALKPVERFGETDAHKDSFAADIYMDESRFYSSLREGRALLLHANQKRGFDAWVGRRKADGDVSDSVAGMDARHPLSALIGERFCKNEKRLSVSPSSLGSYFQCPLKWVFARVLRLEALEIETGLMAENIAGLVYHSVLNLFLDDLVKSGESISRPVDSGTDKKPRPELPASYRGLLKQKVETVFGGFPRLPHGDRAEMSMLTAKLLRSEKMRFHIRLEKFLAEFISFFAGYRVVASEARFSMENDWYNLNGIVDCVLEGMGRDSGGNALLTIVDFKMSKTPKFSDCFSEEDGLSDFQIPAYLRLAENSLKKDVDSALFFSIEETKAEVWFGSVRNIISGVSVPKKAEDCILRESDFCADVMEGFDIKTWNFAAAVRDGFSLAPLCSAQCPDCRHKEMCRILYKVR